MSAMVNWYDDRKTILQVEIHGAWEWEPIMEVLRNAWDQANGVVHPIALIYLLDHDAWRNYPLHDLVTHLRVVYQLQPRHIAPVIAVAQGQIQFVQMLIRSLRPAVPQLRDTYVVANMNEALDVVARHANPVPRRTKGIGVDTGILHSR